jgi:hypothetical protein
MLLAVTLLACDGERVAVEALARNPLHDVERNVDRTPVESVVVERVDAGSYVYVRTSEPRWIVGLSKPLVVGGRVRITPVGRAAGFHSARTGRTFDEVWFAVLDALP